MGKFQDKKSVNNIDQYNEGADRNKAEINAAIADLDSILAIPDADLQLLVDDGATLFPDVSDYKAGIADSRDQYIEQLRLFDMDTQELVFDEIIATYLTFDVALGGAVQSVCGEEVGNEANQVLAQPGKWFHNIDHTHEIILDLGNKTPIDAICITLPAGASDDHQLRGVDVHAAGTMPKIDDPESVMLTNVDFIVLGADNIHVFPGGQKRARFVKLTNISTDDNGGKIKMKVVKVRVIPKFFQED